VHLLTLSTLSKNAPHIMKIVRQIVLLFFEPITCSVDSSLITLPAQYEAIGGCREPIYRRFFKYYA